MTYWILFYETNECAENFYNLIKTSTDNARKIFSINARLKKIKPWILLNLVLCISERYQISKELLKQCCN